LLVVFFDFNLDFDLVDLDLVRSVVGRRVGEFHRGGVRVVCIVCDHAIMVHGSLSVALAIHRSHAEAVVDDAINESLQDYE
jgi:hypothetical protein